MFRRLPQPPVNRTLRLLEQHEFWPGFIAGLVGFILIFCGTRHLTGVPTVDGEMAWEAQLVKAFSVSGGLQYADQVAPPPPPRPDDPVAAAEALDRWAMQNATLAKPSWRVRVDTGAKGGCPT